MAICAFCGVATAAAIASCEEERPVRKMYRFHLSPVIESATAGSTSKIFLYSSATGSMASATPDDVAPAARKTTRPNSSHTRISYALFCLNKKTPQNSRDTSSPPSVHDHDSLT